MQQMRAEKTNTIALGGICVALATIALYGASIIPGAELTLYALASVFVAVMTEEKGISGGFISYLASGILGFFLMPGKLAILPFAFFFGIYPLIKMKAERAKGSILPAVIKLVSFCGIFGIAFAFFRKFFFYNITVPALPSAIIAVGSVFMFIAYDIILTLVIKLYHSRIKRDRRGIKLS